MWYTPTPNFVYAAAELGSMQLKLDSAWIGLDLINTKFVFLIDEL